MNLNTNTARIPLSDLMATPEFQSLTLKQQIFIARLVARGSQTGTYDPVDAATIAYQTKNAAIMGPELLGQTKIRRVLDIHFGRSPLDSILADLQRAAKKSANVGALTPKTVRLLKKFEAYVMEHR